VVLKGWGSGKEVSIRKHDKKGTAPSNQKRKERRTGGLKNIYEKKKIP